MSVGPRALPCWRSPSQISHSRKTTPPTAMLNTTPARRRLCSPWQQPHTGWLSTRWPDLIRKKRARSLEFPRDGKRLPPSPSVTRAIQPPCLSLLRIVRWPPEHASRSPNLSWPVIGGILLLSQRNNRRSLTPPRHAPHARIPPSSWIRIVARMGFRRAAGVAGPFHATIARGGRARRDRPPEFFRFAVLRHARGRNSGFHLVSAWPPQRHQGPPASLQDLA